MFVGFQKEDQQEERVYANSYLTEGDTLPNNECFATAKISASAPRLTSAESTHFPERVKMLEKIKKTAQSFLEQQRQQQKQLENSRQEEKHSKILLRKHTITSNLEMSNEQQPQPLQQRVLPPLQSKYDLFQPAKNEENMEIKNAYKVKIHNQNRPRLPVPHDYQTQPTTHPLRCQKFPTGTIQSHLAKSMRSRRTTFGHSNRIAFLAALGHAERTSSTALYHKNGDHRMTGKFWPETDFCDAKGLTQCGSAFADGRILDVPCIYGRVTGIAEKIPRKDDNPVFDVLAYGVGVRARRVERLLGNSWNNTVEKIHNANGNADFRDVLSSHLLYGCKHPEINRKIEMQDALHPKINTRYSANKEWFHDTLHNVQAKNDSHFYIPEDIRLSHEPWVDDKHKQKKEQYKEKLKYFVRDKNALSN